MKVWLIGGVLAAGGLGFVMLAVKPPPRFRKEWQVAVGLLSGTVTALLTVVYVLPER